MSWLPASEPKCDVADRPDPVQTIVVPRASDLGGFEVRRALPSSRRRMVGPFIFFDQMGPAKFLSGHGLDVRPHPHIGLATVTYLMDGTIVHRDSLGTELEIRPGDVNWMTAGRGIAHSERSGEATRRTGGRLFGIQSWVALPRTHEETTPAFVHHGKAELPEIREPGLDMRVIVGAFHGAASPVSALWDSLYVDIAMQPGTLLPIPPDTEERALYAVEGELEIGGTRYDPMQLLVLHPRGTVTARALTPVRVLLFGGAAMDGRRHIWWNFVSSSKERIEQAKADWKAGRFKAVPNETEFIPLPEG